MKMSWKNYEAGIVEKHLVVLVGWPSAVMDLAALSLAQLETLVKDLREERCHWKAISDEELRERRKTIPLVPKAPCRGRSDAGEARGSYKKRKGKAREEYVNSGSESSSD